MALLTGPNSVSVPNTSEIIHLARIIQDKKGKQSSNSSVRPGGGGRGSIETEGQVDKYISPAINVSEDPGRCFTGLTLLLRKRPTDDKGIKLTSVYSYLSTGKKRHVTLTSILRASLNALDVDQSHRNPHFL
jgi:hypothetical protein